MGKIKYCWHCGKEVPYQEYQNIDFIPKCPNCDAKYPEKPRDEALLSIYQDDYLANRTDKNMNRLFNLMSKVTFNVICHKLKSTSSHEDMDEIWDKVQWTLEKITKYYKEKPEFKISTSFVKYISQVILFPLYNKEEQDKQKKEISIHTPKFGGMKDGKKELYDYLSSETDGGINETENVIDYKLNQNKILKETVDYVNTVIESLYKYEKSINSNKAFRNSFYMAQLYKYFICTDMNDKVIEDIINSMDFTLIKKFEKSKDIYKTMLLKHASGE